MTEESGDDTYDEYGEKDYEEDYEEYGEEKQGISTSLRIILWIFGILIGLYLLGLIGVHSYTNFYLEDELHSETQFLLTNMVNQKLSTVSKQSFYLDVKETNNSEQLKNNIENARKAVNKEYSKFKEEGVLEIRDKEVTYDCENGSVFKRPKVSRNIPECYNISSGKKSFSDTKKEFELEGDIAVRQLADHSTQIFLSKKIENNLKFLKEEKNDFDGIMAILLDSTLDISRTALLGTSFIRLLEPEKNEQSNIIFKNNSKKGLEIFEKYVENISVPSKKEIRNIELKENCIYKEMEDRGMDKKLEGIGKEFGKPLVTSISKIFFASPSTSEMCEQSEKFLKEKALVLYEEIKKSENPFYDYFLRMELNSIVKCGNDPSCASDYMKSRKENEIKLRDSLGIIKLCSDSPECDEGMNCSLKYEDEDIGKDYKICKNESY